MTLEVESGLKCTQQVAKLSFRDHNKTNPKPVLSSSKYHTVFPNYAQVFQMACFIFSSDIPMKIFLNILRLIHLLQMPRPWFFDNNV